MSDKMNNKPLLWLSYGLWSFGMVGVLGLHRLLLRRRDWVTMAMLALTGLAMVYMFNLMSQIIPMLGVMHDPDSLHRMLAEYQSREPTLFDHMAVPVTILYVGFFFVQCIEIRKIRDWAQARI